MSFITKLTNIFAKKESQHQLGVALRQDALASCFITETGEFEFQQQPINEGDFAKAFKQLLNMDNVAGQAHVILSPSQYQIVQIDKPDIPDAEIHSALKWQVKDLVTIAPEDMVLDYFSGPLLAGGNEKINVVVASKSALQIMVAQFERSDAILKTISTEEFAFASLVPKQEQATLLVCQQPNEEILILIVKEGRLFFHRRLRGFAQISSKTPEELAFGTIDSLSLEIQRSTDYFERQLKQPPIKEIQLILPIKTESYLVNKLAENTNTTVNVFPLNDQIIDRKMYATAFGATSLAAMEAQ